MRHRFITTGIVAMLCGVMQADAAQPRVAQGSMPSTTPTPLVTPMPLPSNVATPSPLFTDYSYFYRGEPNDPKKHPIPPEVQDGFKRDNHIYCLDWSRALRTSRPNKWEYFVTTCQCYPDYIIEALPKAKP